MPIKSVNQDVAEAINILTDLLKRDYGCDFAYSISGRGFVLAQHNINGIKHPVPSEHPEGFLYQCHRCEFNNFDRSVVVNHLITAHQFGHLDATASLPNGGF